ncbi:MAG: VWA domain-containing protein [Planctomycetota bacterium]|nr:VWA domain-containing protein [Planctomycetota bacterium]MDA1178886.1 VWA domain-containing protein [Planctomycetota bacterium]
MHTKRTAFVSGVFSKRFCWPVVASSVCHLVLAFAATSWLIESPIDDVLHLEFRTYDREASELVLTPLFEIPPPKVVIETQVEVEDVVVPSINLDFALISLGGSQGTLSTESHSSKMIKAIGRSTSGVGQGSGDAERGSGNGRGGNGAYEPFNALLENLRQGLDLVIVFDSTSSMEYEINVMKMTFMHLATRLLEVLPNTRIACVTYKDTTDTPVVAYSALTNDLHHVHAFLSQVRASGGGQDIPEAVELGLWQAIDGFPTRNDAVKVILLFGDAPPRPDGFNKAMGLARRFSSNSKNFRLFR